MKIQGLSIWVVLVPLLAGAGGQAQISEGSGRGQVV